MALKRVSTGQPIVGRDIRTLMESAHRFRAQPLPVSARVGGGLQGAVGEMLIRDAVNMEAATAFDLYSVAVVKGIYSAVGDRNALLKVGVRGVGDNEFALAVCLDPLPIGGIGRVCLGGLTWAKGSGTGAYATLGESAVTLTRGASGNVLVLAASGAYLYVRFPVGGVSSTLTTNWDYSGILVLAGTWTEPEL